MESFVVVEIAGKQYKVKSGDTLLVNRIEGKDGEKLTFDRVFLAAGGKKTDIGTPLVKGAKVEAKIVAQEKGEKINVRRYKSKVRYRKSTGFRPKYTKIQIISV